MIVESMNVSVLHGPSGLAHEGVFVYVVKAFEEKRMVPTTREYRLRTGTNANTAKKKCVDGLNRAIRAFSFCRMVVIASSKVGRNTIRD